MSLNGTNLERIAHLARLNLNPTKIQSFTQDLDNILNLVDKMNTVNIAGVEPMAHPLDSLQPLRADQVTEINQRDLLLKNAPQSYMGLFMVPAVIETGE